MPPLHIYVFQLSAKPLPSNINEHQSQSKMGPLRLQWLGRIDCSVIKEAETLAGYTHKGHTEERGLPEAAYYFPHGQRTVSK